MAPRCPLDLVRQAGTPWHLRFIESAAHQLFADARSWPSRSSPPAGIYQLRRKVPNELRRVLGHEYKRSLKTRDPSEAKSDLPRSGRDPTMYGVSTPRLANASPSTVWPTRRA
ncbi:DUF6538 domain-containing protein [Variovorax sp. CF313]|uniref:DUF6538 domain-containing protein n=1 Tax=Variovorax sp. CF313 TaxID=1144315 RepID=UPI003FD35C16